MIEIINKEGRSALLTLWRLRCLEKTGEKTLEINCPECKCPAPFPIKKLKKMFAETIRTNILNTAFRRHLVELYESQKEFKLSEKESIHAGQILIILDEEVYKEKKGDKNDRKRQEQTGDL